MDAICDDLAAEHDALDAIVQSLSESEWKRSTPAVGWTIQDQIDHLTYFDGTATLALTDPDAFTASVEALLASLSADDPTLAEARAMRGADLLERWRTGRAALLAELRRTDPKARVPWYGPPMSAVSFATARLMETWAHGQDIVDALGVTRQPTDRLRHIAHIGVRARRFSYATNGREAPDADVRVELRAPSGEVWTWNESSTDRVSGDALDFCLVVTQRRHVADTGLDVDGPLAKDWIAIAQAFAGPPGTGRKPGQFTASR
ncbi:MAG TPA: TIGR03084 family metal-binding protein [Acidimicrobiales bacterium]|nr:TIGR03084 family metal-binding protein [Acidimicrobiales bacterium]